MNSKRQRRGRRILKKHLVICCLIAFLPAACQTSVQDSVSVAAKRLEAISIQRQPQHNDAAIRVDTDKYRTDSPANVATSVPSEISDGLQESPGRYRHRLAEHLVAGINDPFLQVKALHDWVALNIAYDTESYFAGAIPSQDYQDVLLKKTAVCSGYANLFEALASAAGITSYTISGYGRGYGSSLFNEADISESNHAWNAVLINEVWYLLDTTWNAGHLDGTSFRPSYTTAYLFLEPEYMIYTHFPTDSRHQLLETPLTGEKFNALPYFNPRFFAYGLLPDTELQRMNRAEDRTVFTFASEHDEVRISARLRNETGRIDEERTLVQRSNGESKITVTFPEAGAWAVQIFAARAEENTYQSVGEIGFKAAAGTQDQFPLRYRSFNRRPGMQLSPKYSPLKHGSRQRFEFILPGYHSAFLSTGEERFPLHRRDGTHQFAAEIRVPQSSHLTLYAGSGDRGARYTGLLQYRLEP